MKDRRKSKRPGSKDRRGGGRSPIELAASFGIGEDPRPEREAKIDNISSGGFCFLSENKPRVGQEVQVSIDLDVRDDVILNAKVVWVQEEKASRKYKVGVRLLETEGPEYERFIEFCKQQT